FAAWTATALPFYPHAWAVGLALVCAAATAFRDRLGLACALAVPVLPLGNVSLGLALLYAALAVGWIAVFWRQPRAGLLFVLGPLLRPLGRRGARRRDARAHGRRRALRDRVAAGGGRVGHGRRGGRRPGALIRPRAG